MVAVIEWAHRLPVADATLRIDVKDLLAAISLPHGRQVDRRDSRRGRGGPGTILPRAPPRPRPRVNERGQEVHTLRDLTLEEGLYANAGMYAWAKSIAAGDLADRGAA